MGNNFDSAKYDLHTGNFRVFSHHKYLLVQWVGDFESFTLPNNIKLFNMRRQYDLFQLLHGIKSLCLITSLPRLFLETLFQYNDSVNIKKQNAIIGAANEFNS